MHIAIIGAGMAGLSCAQALQSQGHAVILFDKARGPGGRMSSRRVPTPAGEATFDHGAQYFTVRDASFVDQVARWKADGIVAHWPAAGADVWIGTPAMNAPIRAMAADLDVRWHARIAYLSRDTVWHLRGDGIEEGPFDAVVIAVPAEQISPLVEQHDPSLAATARSVSSDPCWTVMVAFDRPVAIEADTLEDTGVIGWAARNSAKPGRSGPESWVIQASPAWSRDHLEDDGAAVQSALLTAFAQAAGSALPDPIATSVHRWRYARSGKLGIEALWNADLGLGLCGDWLLGPRIEAAWLSGQGLAALIGR